MSWADSCWQWINDPAGFTRPAQKKMDRLNWLTREGEKEESKKFVGTSTVAEAASAYGTTNKE